MEYRYEATSVAGFVQQLAVAYMGRGYPFTARPSVPSGNASRSASLRPNVMYGNMYGRTRNTTDFEGCLSTALRE
jgi:hypothetical protein